MNANMALANTPKVSEQWKTHRGSTLAAWTKLDHNSCQQVAPLAGSGFLPCSMDVQNLVLQNIDQMDSTFGKEIPPWRRRRKKF